MMNILKLSTLRITFIPLLLTLIPTVLVWLYFSSLDIETWNNRDLQGLYSIPPCMAVGFLSLSIYLFVLTTPQQIEKNQLRDVLFIVVVWMALSLAVLLNFLGSITFWVVDASTLMMMFILWLIWGVLNVRAYRHTSNDYVVFTVTILWSWLAYVIITYVFYRQYILPTIQIIVRG